MEIKTIADLKAKLIKTVDDIDTSKLTLCDLNLLANTVSVISNINEKNFDFTDALAKIYSSGSREHQTTLSDLKEGK